MTRRQLVHKLAAVAGGSRLASLSLADAWAQPATGSSIKLGAQTNAWSIDPTRFDTFLGVLSQIRKIGYAGFETGFVNVSRQFKSPEAARISIANTGLTFFGIHIFVQLERNDPATKLPPASLYEEVRRGGIALGAQRLIFSGGPAASTDDVKRKIAGLNAAGAFSKSLGLRFAYHNHLFEFSIEGGRNQGPLCRDRSSAGLLSARCRPCLPGRGRRSRISAPAPRAHHRAPLARLPRWKAGSPGRRLVPSCRSRRHVEAACLEGVGAQ
jgi:hypothetical protein